MDSRKGRQVGSSRSLSSLRVLMQMRSNALTQRGGDTVVMERITEGLRQRGHHVDIDLIGTSNPREYDIVHLYNFCTPEITEQFARKCVEQQTPFVVTTMYEDWPFFFNPMAATYMVFERYVELGQPKAAWAEMMNAIKGVPPAAIQRNDFTAAHAEALIPTGKAEKKALLRDYPNTKRVEIYHCGCEVTSEHDNGELFRKTYGISDFILCVGRLEWRKNQLMILKALEDSDLPMVFLTGGFTYQPQYDAVMRKFKRRGPTHFIGKVAPDMLASAFGAARAHVLPSWYELPGLVSIEAAHYGTNVVVSDYGTIADYLGDTAYYCKPDDENSIRQAIEQAYIAPRSNRIKEQVTPFTWENATTRNLEIYAMALSEYGYTGHSSSVGLSENAQLASSSLKEALSQVNVAGQSVAALSAEQAGAEEICNQGDILAKSGKTDEAFAKYNEALRVNPNANRAHRGLGVIALTQNQTDLAETHFKKAVLLDSSDIASNTGLATALWNKGAKEEAFKRYQQSLAIKPTHKITLTYIIGAAFELARLPELEQALSRCLEIEPDNVDMQFCLAGCLFKQGKRHLTRMVVKQLLSQAPDYEAAKELLGLLDKAEDSGNATANNQVESSSVQIIPPRSASEQVVEPFSLMGEVEKSILKMEDLQRKKHHDDVVRLGEELLLTRKANNDQQALIQIIVGEARACRNELDVAEKNFHSTETNPTYGYRAICGRGIVAAVRNDWNTAVAFFNRSLRLKPDHDVALAGLGMCAAQKNDLQTAWEYYQKALEKNPENLRALFGVIQIGYPLQKLSELESSLNRYLEFNPANLSILYAHAGCCYAQGKHSEAVTQLEKIKIFEPDHKLANELLDQISRDNQQSRKPQYQ